MGTADMQPGMQGIPPEFIAGFWDSPMVSGIAFHPRTAAANEAPTAEIQDGTIEVAEGVALAYRMYKRPKLDDGNPPTVLVFHHGNAEMITDLEGRTQPLHDMGCAVLAVEYRGFAWSTGHPALKHLSADSDKVAEAIPGILEACDLAGAPCVLWGRSIGATCAVQLAAAHGDQFKGLIVESGLMDIRSLPLVQQMSFMLPGGPELLKQLPDPLGTLDKLANVVLPTLVMHGDQDEIVPVDQGHKCHDGIKAEAKTLHIFAGAGHNDVQAMHGQEYMEEMGAFLVKMRS